MAAGGCWFSPLMQPRNINIADYDYELPPDRIAAEPLQKRDESKLLVYQKNKISISNFASICKYIPAGDLMVFNNTRVINARIKFLKPTGGIIEIFCLEPAVSFLPYEQVMAATGHIRYKCFVGGAAKWKDTWLEKRLRINEKDVQFKARRILQEADYFIIEFSWKPITFSFAEIIESAGLVPLPPYIKREAKETDRERYQTIYAAHDGSVAAPTAGLHFTQNVFDSLKNNDVDFENVTLHVGAGTFKPVNAIRMKEHNMHAEYMNVSKDAIEKLTRYEGKITAVGTTSLRTLESLYWFGVKLLTSKNDEELSLGQWEIYDSLKMAGNSIPLKAALEALLIYLNKEQKNSLFTRTQLLIAPGYKFKVCNRLVTNFHQPKSTLLLLVAAAIGKDWKNVYAYALDNGFRFLSYGDSSLIEF